MIHHPASAACSCQPDVMAMARRRARPHAESRPSPFDGVPVPTAADLAVCIRCGLCFPHCPTYAITQLEKDSPRGRIRLIKEVAEGGLDLTRSVADALGMCLLCRACETACPADVHYGRLAEAARAAVEQARVYPGAGRRLLRALLLRQTFTRPRLLRAFGRALRLYQKHLRPPLDRTGALRLLPRSLRRIEPLAPSIPARFGCDLILECTPAVGERKRRVGVLSGCVMDIAFGDVNADTVAVLRLNGCDVVVPREQVCCGSLHAHNGDLETARRLARRNIEVFERAEVEFVVVNSAGCGSWMLEYGEALASDRDWADRAKAFAAKVLDVSPFLVKIGLKPPAVPVRRRAVYDDPCHLIHGQGVSKEPRQLLAMIPGLDLVELEEADWCCGAAGIYSLTNTDESMRILDRKMDRIRKTGADLILTGNPGCLAQLRYGVRRHRLSADVLHPVTLLRMAYGLDPPPNAPPPTCPPVSGDIC